MISAISDYFYVHKYIQVIGADLAPKNLYFEWILFCAAPILPCTGPFELVWGFVCVLYQKLGSEGTAGS